jgi:hypothetical protein
MPDNANSPQSPAGLLTIPEFGRLYGPRTTKTFALLNTGAIEGRRFGARTYITRESAERWAASLPKWTPTKPTPADAGRTRKRA